VLALWDTDLADSLDPHDVRINTIGAFVCASTPEPTTVKVQIELG
jgi:hypothetical protein